MRYLLQIKFLPFIGLLLLFACKQNSGNASKTIKKATETGAQDSGNTSLKNPMDLKAVDISLFRKTSFVPTLENKIENDKNTIYTPSFLYAWRKLKSLINRPIKVDAVKEPFLALINKSNTFEGSIEDSKLHDTFKILDDGSIKITSSFARSLPFAWPFDELEIPVKFSNQDVLSYGIKYHFEQLASEVDILYYKDDQCFVLGLRTGNDTDEIILAKGLPNGSSLGDYVHSIEHFRQIGKKESLNENNKWKYHFNKIDALVIPVIKFNINAEYKELIGANKFSTRDRNWKIFAAEQETSFILDQNGASVSSQALIITDSVAPRQPKLTPKKLIFDSPFVVVLKHKNVANPYFVARIANAELMVKEK